MRDEVFKSFLSFGMFIVLSFSFFNLPVRLEFIGKMPVICEYSQRWEIRIFHCCLLPHLSSLLPHTLIAFAKSQLKQAVSTRSSIKVKFLHFKRNTGLWCLICLCIVFTSMSGFVKSRTFRNIVITFEHCNLQAGIMIKKIFRFTKTICKTICKTNNALHK